MAENSAVDEMMDIGTGLNESLGCAVAAIFYIGSAAILLSSLVAVALLIT